MPGKTYTVKRVPLLKVSTRRGVAFLCCREDDKIDADVAFESLDDKKEKEVRSRFEYWIDGGTHDTWFHRFNHEDYRECFVFKWRAKRQHHRLYGFLCQPRPRTDGRFQLCVLTSHAKKNQEATDVTELDGANALRVEPLVHFAITMEFPEKGGGNAWPN